MGTITKIRQFSPYVFVVFAVLFITFMVLSDSVTNLATSDGETLATAAICKINGEKIYYRDYEERVRIRIDQMRNDPQNAGREIDEQNVRNQVWDEMIREMLLKQAAEHLGIKVSDEEILDILIDNPPDYLRSSFTDSAGVFNRQLYLEIITNPEILVNYLGQDPNQMDPQIRARYVSDFRNQLIAITDFLRLQKTNEAISSTLNAAYAISSPSYIERKFIDDNSTATINFIFVGANTITDSIEVTDEEIRTFYNKNKSNFKSKNERKVKSIMFPISPSAEDTARNNRRVEQMRTELANAESLEKRDSIFSVKMNEFVGVENDWRMIQDVPPQISSLFANVDLREVVGPVEMHDGVHFYRLDDKRSGTQEVVKASHILISFNDNKDSARAFAQKLMRDANARNFAELAMQHSEDKGSGSQGGDLGYFGRGRMVPEFEKAAFDARVGSIVGPVESQFGYHIIKVDDKRSEEIKFSAISFHIAVSSATRNHIKRDAFAAMQQLEEGLDIDTLASRLNLHCAESPFITNERPFYGSMFLTNKIFEVKLNEVLEPREVSNGNGIIVVQVTNIKKAGISTLENETEAIRQRLLKIKRLDLAEKKAQEVYNLIKTKETTLEGLDELPHHLRVANASIRNNGVIQGAPTDFAATTHAFKLPMNRINEPIRGEHGYFIFEIKSREIPTVEQATDAQDLTRGQYVRTLFDTWFNNFRDKSDIRDFRTKYFSDF